MEVGANVCSCVRGDKGNSYTSGLCWHDPKLMRKGIFCPKEQTSGPGQPEKAVSPLLHSKLSVKAVPCPAPPSPSCFPSLCQGIKEIMLCHQLMAKPQCVQLLHMFICRQMQEPGLCSLFQQFLCLQCFPAAPTSLRHLTLSPDDARQVGAKIA